MSNGALTRKKHKNNTGNEEVKKTRKISNYEWIIRNNTGNEEVKKTRKISNYEWSIRNNTGHEEV